MSTPRPEDGPAALYRLYNRQRDLLYVGITTNLIVRMANHAGGGYYRNEIAYIEVVWFETWAEAMVAEAHVIASEQPRYNKRSEAKALTMRLPHTRRFRRTDVPAGGPN